MFKDISIVISWVLGFILFIFVIGWLSAGNDFFMYKFFAPKQEAIRREVVETSKSFNDGMLQELSQMQIDYAKGNDDTKNAISNLVVHRYSTYNEKNLSTDLRSFVFECKSRQMGGSK